MNTLKNKIKGIVALAFMAVLGISIMSLVSVNKKDELANLKSKVDSLEQIVADYKAEEALTKNRLMAFDTLDFDFYTNQKWEHFDHSHAEDITVYYPDGTVTNGLDPEHIDALTPMFVFAPDTRIESHPVSFGSGDWTAVIGELEGTFTEPMPIGNGKTIPPTNKTFKLKMATIGHWSGGKMIEEYLFWDNYSFMQQIGLAN